MGSLTGPNLIKDVYKKLVFYDGGVLKYDDGTDDQTISLTETIQDTVGAMFTGNTETNITVTYEDGDGTIDLVAQGTIDLTGTINADEFPQFSDNNTLQALTATEMRSALGLGGGALLGTAAVSNGASTLATGDQIYDFVVAQGYLTAHPNISAASSSDNSGAVFIQDVTLDSNGHVTGLTTATASTLTTEEVQDIVGAMFDSNTETRISASYQDGDGTIDLVVDDMTANDNTWRPVTAGGNSLSASETLAFTAGSNVTITESAGAVTIASTDTNTTYSVGDGGLTQNNFTNTLKTKLDGIEASADVTDTANVTSAGALMDSEVSNLSFVKSLAKGISDGNVLTANDAVADNDFLRIDGTEVEGRTAAEVRSDLNVEDGATADQTNAEIRAAVEAASDSNVFTDADHSKLNGIAASANNYVLPLLDEDDMSSDSATSVPSQQSVKAYVNTIVDGAPGTLDTLNELAAALGDDANYAASTSTAIGLRALKSNNLSDLASASTARSNLGLGALAVLGTVNASTITDNSVGADELNVSGDGSSSQFLRSDGDGTFTWATPTNTDTTYSGGTNLTLDGTTFNVDDAFLKNDANDTTSGTITAGGFTTAGSITLGGHSFNDIDIGSEFNDVDDHLMSAGAIKEKIEAYGYTTDANVTHRTITAGGNTLAGSETLAFTAGSNVTITESGGAVTIASTDTNTQLSTEQVQDIVGAMFTSNTETRIAAEYQDGDGTIDLVVDDMTADTNTTYTAGTGLDLSSTEFSVDVSDFMANGSNNYVLTATGTDAFRGEGNLTFDGSTLAVTGALTTTSSITPGSIVLGGHSFNDIDIGSEFVDADDHLMTSGAIKEKIESYSYLTSVPNHSAALLTSGTLPVARLANIADSHIASDAAISASKIVDLAASKITSGTFDAARIPDSFLKNDANDTTSGTITAAGFTTSGDVTTDTHLLVNSSGVTVRRYVSSWSNAQTHDVVYNGYGSDIGDYVYLKASGNGTAGHGMAIVGDNLFAVGDSNVETGAITNSLTAPMTDTWFYVNGSGNGWFKGSATVAGVLHVQSGDDFALGEIADTLRMKGNSTNSFNFLNNGNGWAHLNCGNVVAAGSVSIGGHAVDDIDVGSEFVDTDDHLMTSGAIKEKIESYGYSTTTGDITGVTAGTGLSGGGTSGGVTLNLDVGDLGLVGNGSLDSATNTAAEYASLPVGYSKMMHSSLGTDEGMPVDSKYFYFHKIANRDTGGGWGGLAFAYSEPHLAYLGTTTTSSSFATWQKILVENASGNVGIGTTSPAQALDIPAGRVIVGNNYGYVQRDAAGNSATILNQNGSDILLIGDTTHTEQIKIQTAHSTGNGGLFLSNDGNVSISGNLSLSSPMSCNYGLTINEGGNDSDTRIEGDSNTNLVRVDASEDRVGIGTGSPSARFHVYSDAESVMWFQNGSTSNVQSIEMDSSRFYFYNRTASAFNSISVLNDGKVGIGQITPGYKLDVSGDARFTNDLRSEGRLMGQNGSAAAPAYSFTSQGNAGMYRYGTGIGFTAAGTERVRIESDKLYITGAGVNTFRIQFPNDQRIYDNGSGGLRVGAASHELELYSGGSDPIAFITGGISGTERMRIDDSGNVGIGTTSPEGKVHIYQSDASVAPDSDGDDLVIESDADTGISILAGESNGETGSLIFGSDNDAYGAGLAYHYYDKTLSLKTAHSSGILRLASANNATAMTIDASKDVKIEESLGIGVAASSTTGRLDCSNDVVAYASSDKRLKENIKPLDNALDKVMQISGVEFDWKKLTEKEKETIHGNEGHDVGVIAQEIEEVLPEVVTQRDSGYKAVKYEKIVPLLIEAIKELKQEIQELKNG